MKTSLDPRHQRRIQLMQHLFAHSFQVNTPDNAEITTILTNLPAIDQALGEAAPEWPIEKIAKIDLAILRLGIYELTVNRTEPEKVVIDEAIELAKEFGNEKSSSFVNGVLGTVLKQKAKGGSV